MRCGVVSPRFAESPSSYRLTVLGQHRVLRHHAVNLLDDIFDLLRELHHLSLFVLFLRSFDPVVVVVVTVAPVFVPSCRVAWVCVCVCVLLALFRMCSVPLRCLLLWRHCDALSVSL